MDTHETQPEESVSAVAVEVTTPDGKPGLVREDDKAPTLVQPLDDTEVGKSINHQNLNVSCMTITFYSHVNTML